MNYRHAFHAGNFADVVKHVAFMRVLAHLRRKEAAFRVIDTHAGTGLYDLTGEEARRGGEWKRGIHRILHATFDAATTELLAPYLDAVAAANGAPAAIAAPAHPSRTGAAEPPARRKTAYALKRYPGSPLLALAAMRPQDRLLACESEAGIAALLRRNLRDPRATGQTIDGWTGLNAAIPPAERRGVVLIDPPFEQPDEFDRLADALLRAHRKWPTGTYLAWYPLKDFRACAAFGRALARFRIPKILRAELTLPAEAEIAGLRGTGLVAINPPFTLEAELARLLPAIGKVLADGQTPAIGLDWIAGEK